MEIDRDPKIAAEASGAAATLSHVKEALRERFPMHLVSCDLDKNWRRYGLNFISVKVTAISRVNDVMQALLTRPFVSTCQDVDTNGAQRSACMMSL